MEWAAEARRRNLCQPFHSEPTLAETCLATSEYWDLNERVDDHQFDLRQGGLQRFRDDASNDKWKVDRDGATFLASVIAMSSMSLPDGLVATPRWNDIRTIEPMLKTDPEMEMRRLRRRHAVSFRRHKRIGLIEEPPELNPWTESELNLLQTVTHEVNTARLDIDRPTMQLLRDLSPTTTDGHSILSSHANQNNLPEQARFDEYCTSPLVPYASSPKLPSLAAEVHEVEFTSTPEDPTVLQMARAQHEIEALDEFEHLGMSSPYNLDIGLPSVPIDESVSSPLVRKRARDLRVETPVTAWRWEAGPEKRRKTTYLPDTVLALITPLNSADEDEGGLSMNPLADAATSLGRSAIHQIENEQLAEFDTTMRTRVPAIDMSLPPAPWADHVSQGGLATAINTHRTLLSRFKHELLKEVSLWSGISKIEDTLRKMPFSARCGEIRPDGPFDDGSFTRYHKDMDSERAPDVHSLIALGGHRTLYDEDEEEEELEEVLDLPLEADAPVQLGSMQPLADNSKEMTNHVRPSKTTADGKLDLAVLIQRRMRQLTKQPAKSSGGIHSTEANLAKFMQLSGKTHVVHEAPQGVVHNAPEACEDSAENRTERRVPIDLPVPLLIEPDRAIQAIFSTSILGNTTMIRQLQNLLPGLDMIEREELAAGPKAEQARGQNHNHEADITVSPRTGIIVLSTLQRLNQTGLPGQSSYFGIRARVAVASLRHEHLIVLVSEGRQPQPQQQGGEDGKEVAATGSLNDRDCENLADLTSCALGEDGAEVEVHYVAGGGQELAQWIAACMTQHAVVSSTGGGSDSVKLLRDETQWERFLRRAGMNAFAGQAVLGKVKSLSRFVELSVDERIAQLEGDVGGRGTQVLKRVSRVVDEGWRSIAGGHGG